MKRISASAAQAIVKSFSGLVREITVHSGATCFCVVDVQASPWEREDAADVYATIMGINGESLGTFHVWRNGFGYTSGGKKEYSQNNEGVAKIELLVRGMRAFASVHY